MKMTRQRLRRSRVRWVRDLSHASIVMMAGKYRRRFEAGDLTWKEDEMWTEVWKELRHRVAHQGEYRSCHHVVCLDVMWEVGRQGLGDGRLVPPSADERVEVPDLLWGLLHAEQDELPFDET